jgi:uncharacterized protein
MIFPIILAVLAILAGSVAALAGFGIGSLLTPLLAIKTGISIAVAAVSIAHLCGTALRLYLLRRSVNKQLLLRFGLASAAGGLAGALLHNTIQSELLTIIFGCLLVLAGISELTGLYGRFHLKGPAVWLGGGISGLFGGLVGNQGGIRSAALLSFKLNKKEFVATAAGIALMVDAVRVPVYLAVQWSQLISNRQYILIMIAGVIAGTLGGKRILEKLPENIFQKTVGAVLILIGILVLVQR